MRTVLALAMCGLYIAAVLAGAPRFGPTTTPWFLVGLSAAFVWGYLLVARGRRLTSLSIVAVVTILTYTGRGTCTTSTGSGLIAPRLAMGEARQ